MNIKTITVTVVLGAGLLAGCSSPTVITDKNGKQTVTADKPTYNKSTGFYEYQENGKTVQVNKDDVHGIEQVK